MPFLHEEVLLLPLVLTLIAHQAIAAYVSEKFSLGQPTCRCEAHHSCGIDGTLCNPNTRCPTRVPHNCAIG
eukprot:3831781-Karenia_brevis.AAC.1